MDSGTAPHERVAIVTGGGTGIGRAVALALAADGYSVVVTGRRMQPLQDTTANATAIGARMLAITSDVTDPTSVRTLFSQTKKTYGRLDLLFNNAGKSLHAVPLEDIGYEEWRSVLDTNLSGPFLCTQEAIRMMKNQQPRGGRIINNGSISAHSPRPNSAAYTASKHGITGLTSQIDIGNAATEMTGAFGQGTLQASGRIEVEPTMDLECVARAVVFMAGLPLDANVQFITVMATKMPFVGRG